MGTVKSLKQLNAAYRLLSILSSSYGNGNFRFLYGHLSHDCILTNLCTSRTYEGFYPVLDYFDQQGQEITRGRSSFNTSIVILTGIRTEENCCACGDYFSPADLCLLVEQKTEGIPQSTVVGINLDSNRLICRFTVCSAAALNYEPYLKDTRDRDLTRFSFDRWSAPYFITARPFKKYIPVLREQLNGKKLQDIYTMGCLFNKWDSEPLDTWEPEYNAYEFDEPVIFNFDGLHLDICFHNTSNAKVGINTLTVEEKTYQPYDWRNIKCLFRDVVGHSVKDIVLKTNNREFYDSVFYDYDLRWRPAGGDYFSSLFLVFDNDYAVEIYGEDEYMDISIWEPGNYSVFPADERLIPASENKGGPVIDLCPSMNGEDIKYAQLSIYENKFSMGKIFIADVMGFYDEYDNIRIPINDWVAVLTRWEIFVNVDSYEAMLEALVGSSPVRDTYLRDMFNRCGDRLWKERDSSAEILDDLKQWTAKYADFCDSIMSYGY